MVGSTWNELTHRNFITGRVSFEKQGHRRVMLKHKGLLHVYADANTGRLLGAEMIGPSAEHMGHLPAWAHQAGMTVTETPGMPYYHPVVEEGSRTALRDACTQLADCRLRVAWSRPSRPGRRQLTENGL